jgi:hypothetical protein
VKNNVVLTEHPNASIDEVLKIVRERCDIIGNYFMYAITTDKKFLLRKYEVSSFNILPALNKINKCSVYNVPQEAKFFFHQF